MQNPFIYEGRGKLLRQVAAATNNVVINPASDIADGEFSEVFAGHDCLEFMFEFVIEPGGAGDIIIERCIDETASEPGETYDAVTIAGELVKEWRSTLALPGFWRVQNTCGQRVAVYLQKRIK